MKNPDHSGIDVTESRVGPNQAFTKLFGFVKGKGARVSVTSLIISGFHCRKLSTPTQNPHTLSLRYSSYENMKVAPSSLNRVFPANKDSLGDQTSKRL